MAQQHKICHLVPYTNVDELTRCKCECGEDKKVNINSRLFSDNKM